MQLYALRYGTLPVVHRTGGLADSVVQITPESLADGRGTGFLFKGQTPGDLAGAAAAALLMYRDHPESWRQAQRNAMAQDLGWEGSARRYLDVYRGALATRDERRTAT